MADLLKVVKPVVNTWIEHCAVNSVESEIEIFAKKYQLYDSTHREYVEEKAIADFLGLRYDSANYVLAYYGMISPDKISGWQIVCHLSKIKMYLAGKVHPEHRKKTK